MPQISRFYDILIYMYAKDHNPPHFYAICSDEEAMIDIKNKVVMNGSLPARAIKLVIDWAELHADELMANFIESQQPNPKFKAIKPLK